MAGLIARWRDLIATGWATLRGAESEAWRNLQSELAPGHQWRDRVVVLAFAAVTGLLVVGLAYLSDVGVHAFAQLSRATPLGTWIAFVWTPAVTVALVWWTRRFVPGAMGSGIPQVLRALDTEMPEQQRRWAVSLRVSLHKVGLVAGGMLAGLSIGREGPAVQVGAGVMLSTRRWLSSRSTIDGHDLMVAGAAAGLAAAFNTPLGGIVFALEQLSRRRGITHSSLVIAAIVLAGLVSISVFGNISYFGQLRVQDLSSSLLVPGLVVALATGLAGGLFSRLIVASAQGLPDRFSGWRRQYPLRFAAGCGLAVAAIAVVTDGATAGAGYAPTRAMLEARADVPPLFTLLKFCATWLSTWSGVPAGLFAPSLAIGASIGHDIAQLSSLSPEATLPLIALGMVGFLAAATQEPITAFIIVMEMVAGHSMVLSLMACAMVASGVSRLVARPLYGQLALLLPVPPATPPAPTSTPPNPPAA